MYCVYFIRDLVTSDTKIGRTSDLRKRLHGLQTSTPHRLRVVDYVVCDSEQETIQLESFYHHHMRGQWISGEWYRDVRDFQIRDLKSHCFNFVRRAQQAHFDFDSPVAPQIITMPEPSTFTFIVQAGRKAA
jgi:hypothetical protein